MYGYEVEQYKTEYEKFNFTDFKDTNMTTVDEWPKFHVEYIIATKATHATYPFFNTEATEEF